MTNQDVFHVCVASGLAVLTIAIAVVGLYLVKRYYDAKKR